MSRRPSRSILCVALLLFAAGARHARAQVGLRGVVRDAVSSRPLSGAVITVASPGTNVTTRSDETGAFVFARLAPGAYTVVARRLGYEPIRQTIDVESGAPPITIELARVATLDTVRVSAAEQGIFGAVGTAHDLRPLPSATIQILGAGTYRLDSTAHFFVPIKTPGVYFVRAQTDGYVAQTVSVTVPRNEGVEVALLLDSATGPAQHELAMAFAEFNDRLLRRRTSSALVPRSELTKDGGGQMLAALRSARAFAIKALRFGETACVFVDGRPRPGMSLNAIDAAAAEAIEIYTSSSEASGTLAQRWPRGFPCADTGMPRVAPGSDVVRWVVIWLKH